MAGGKRDMGAKHVPGRQRARQGDRRVQTALEKARSDQRALDARMAAEAEETRLAEAAQPVVPIQLAFMREVGAAAAAAQNDIDQIARKVVNSVNRDPWRQGLGTFYLVDARRLLRDGYHVDQVVRKTGWGPAWFADDIGEDGYLK